MVLRLPRRCVHWLQSGPGRLPALALSVLLALLLALPGEGVLPALRLAWFDACQVAMPRQRVSGPVQIIAIDEAALKQFGQWPWPRTRLAELIARAAAQQPLAIGLDMILPESDMTSPEALAARMQPGALRDALVLLPTNDAVLALAMRHAPVVLGAAGLREVTGISGAGNSGALRAWPVHVAGGNTQGLVLTFPQALASLPQLQAAARGQGLLSALLEKGMVRRVPLVAGVAGTLLPALSIELLRVATGSAAIEVLVGGHGITAIAVGDLQVPVQSDGSVWVHFSAPAPERYISALDLMQGRIDVGTLQNKIVIVALTGLGLADAKTNARGDLLPGADVHAQLIESFFDGHFLQRPDWMRAVEVFSFAALSLLMLWLLPLLRLGLAASLALALALLPFAAGALLFARAGLLFDAATVCGALVLVCLCLLMCMLAGAVRARQRSERALQQARVTAAARAGELEAARRIQMASLPQADRAFPGETRFVLDALLEPAREVGGDLYDFFMLDADRVFFLIGDVSGKGVPASLFMAVAKALSKSIALRGPADLALIMKQANLELVRENPDMLFVTGIAGMLDAASGAVMLCNAGHDAPRRLCVHGQVERLQPADGPPLCVLDDFDYPVQHYQLQPGECLCLSTDGISEAMNQAGEQYGNARLDALLSRLGQGGMVMPSALVQAVRSDVHDYVGAAEPSDDLTLLVLRWDGVRS